MALSYMGVDGDHVGIATWKKKVCKDQEIKQSVP